MKRTIWLVLLAVPTLSLAQAAPHSTAAVANPAATVPAPEYRSALAHGPRGVAQDSVDWKAANAEVGRNTRGHTDILKWEQAQGAAAPATTPAPPQRGREMGHGTHPHNAPPSLGKSNSELPPPLGEGWGGGKR